MVRDPRVGAERAAVEQRVDLGLAGVAFELAEQPEPVEPDARADAVDQRPFVSLRGDVGIFGEVERAPVAPGGIARAAVQRARGALAEDLPRGGERGQRFAADRVEQRGDLVRGGALDRASSTSGDRPRRRRGGVEHLRDGALVRCVAKDEKFCAVRAEL